MFNLAKELWKQELARIVLAAIRDLLNLTFVKVLIMLTNSLKIVGLPTPSTLRWPHVR